MAHTNRNFVFAYAFLVILPIVGLAGILKSGHKLTAPSSIDGVWNFQLDSAELDSLPCGKMFAAIPDKAIAISQSGTTFALNSAGGPKLAGSGTLDGTLLRGSLTSPQESPSEMNCPAGSQLSLAASVERSTGSKALVGSLSAANCPTCPAVPFRAERQLERQPLAPAKGGH
jgi:hypothetical protein